MELTEQQAALVGSIISLLVTALFIHFGASIVVKGDQKYTQALLVAFGGNLLAAIVLIGAGGFGGLAVFLALAAWALVAALVYRTSWLGGAVIGLVAWLIWAFIQWLVRTTLAATV